MFQRTRDAGACCRLSGVGLMFQGLGFGASQKCAAVPRRARIQGSHSTLGLRVKIKKKVPGFGLML